MDRWKTLKMWMEDNLKDGFLAMALSHLDAMKACCSPEDLYGILSSHTLNDLPTFHYLARFPFREEDIIPRLDKLIGTFTDLGYDINQSSSSYCGWKISGSGATALTASIDQQNLVLMECLLRHDARTDIRDENNLSACHWAIKVDDLRYLEKLVQFAGPSVLAYDSSETNGEWQIPPVLHMAVDKGHTEIVSYLLRKWMEFGVDVNEKAFYKQDLLVNKRNFGDFDTTMELLTPLESAIRRRNTPIVRVLLEHRAIKLSGFKELHYCLEKGVPEVALILVDFFFAEDLAVDKIGGRWALHCLHPKAFHQVEKVEHTRKLILEYVRSGWNVDSVSTFRKSRTVFMKDVMFDLGILRRCTLLHLACLYKGQPEIIQVLVEAGANINCMTEGDLELTPLQISLAMKQWRTAAYLIENRADLEVRGSFKERIPFTQVIRTAGIWEPDPNPSFDAVELLVAMACEEGLPLLDHILARPDYLWHGANEFHLAVESANPVYISKVLKHCSMRISKKELNFVTRKASDGTVEKIPTLFHVLSTLSSSAIFLDVPALANFIKLLEELGYDPNLFRRLRIGGRSFTESAIGHILAIDFSLDSSNLLLRTVLQDDHLQLSLDSVKNPVELALYQWSRLCSLRRKNCWQYKPLPPPSVEAIKLLLIHGLDVTGMVIDADFTYHFGYNFILKMLYSAGVQISEEFFISPRICQPGHPESQSFLQEIAEVKRWKDEFDRKEGCSLKHMCRYVQPYLTLRVRKMVKCIGDLKMLDGLPGGLKEYVLCQA